MGISTGAAPPPNRAVRASQNFRESLRWLTATFGAIAAVVVAGFAISDVGGLALDESWGAREVVAVIGAALAVGGVGWGLVETVSATTDAGADAAAVEASPLVRPENGLTAGYANGRELVEAYVGAEEATRRAWEDHLADPTDDRAFADLRARSARRDDLRTQLLGAAEFVSVTELRRSVRARRRRIVVAYSAAALGTVSLVWAANGPSPAAPVIVGPEELVVTISIDEAASEVLQAQLGSTCDVDALAAIVLEVTDDGADVVSVPTESCPRAVRFTLSDAVGEIVAPEG